MALMRSKTLTRLVVRHRPGNPRQGWLVAGPFTLPVSLGRGGIKANKREGDGGTPRGTFRLKRLWWRADRQQRPATQLPSRRIGSDDGWCEDPGSRHYNRPVKVPPGSAADRLALLERMHHPTQGLWSKPWDVFTRANNPDAPELDFVFTVCDSAAGEMCPIWPGQPMTAHWGMPDPALFQGSEAETAVVFADTYRMLTNRIGLFVNLPIRALDRLSLQKRLDQIGHSNDQTAGQPEQV